jgi:phage-related protein
MATQYSYGYTEVQILDTLKALKAITVNNQSTLIDAVDLLYKDTSKQINVLSGGISELNNLISEGLGINNSEVIDTIGNMYNEVSEWLNGSISKVNEYISDVYNDVSGFFTLGYDNLKNTFSEVWEGVKDTYSEYDKLFNDTIEGLNKNMSDALFWSSAQLNLAYENMSRTVDEVLHNSNKYIEQSIASIQNITSTLLNETTSFFAILYSDIREDLTKATEINEGEIVDAMTSMFNTYKESFNKLMNERDML